MRPSVHAFLVSILSLLVSCASTNSAPGPSGPAAPTTAASSDPKALLLLNCRVILEPITLPLVWIQAHSTYDSTNANRIDLRLVVTAPLRFSFTRSAQGISIGPAQPNGEPVAYRISFARNPATDVVDGVIAMEGGAAIQTMSQAAFPAGTTDLRIGEASNGNRSSFFIPAHHGWSAFFRLDEP